MPSLEGVHGSDEEIRGVEASDPRQLNRDPPQPGMLAGYQSRAEATPTTLLIHFPQLRSPSLYLYKSGIGSHDTPGILLLKVGVFSGQILNLGVNLSLNYCLTV